MSENETIIFRDLINTIDPLTNQYPIPSYDLEINTVSAFKENETISTSRDDPKGKRTVIICGKPAANQNSPVLGTVWAFSMDGKDTLGPFELDQEQNLLIDIDERPWGALINPADDKGLTVSIWIE